MWTGFTECRLPATVFSPHRAGELSPARLRFVRTCAGCFCGARHLLSAVSLQSHTHHGEEVAPASSLLIGVQHDPARASSGQCAALPTIVPVKRGPGASLVWQIMSKARH